MLFVAWMAGSVSASETGLYDIEIIDLPLDTVLDVVGRDLGVEFSVDGSRRQRVKNITLSGNKEAVVSGLMREIGMDSFSFNGQIYVSPADQREVRLVRLTDVSVAQAVAALNEAGLILPDYAVSEVAGGGAVVLSGPVKYLAISEGVIASLEAQPELARQTVRIRRAGIVDTGSAGGAAVDAATE